MKYAVILGNVGSCSDRYMTGGYSEPFTVEQLFERLSTIDNVHAVEFVGGWQLTLDNRQMVKEQLEKFGVPVLVERSSYESGPLARMEWVKLYGVLLGKTDEAEQVFDDAVQRIAPLENESSTGKTVAFFSITSNNLATVRKGGDYVAKMIEMAGGDYVFSDLTDSGNNLATVNISLEDFYAGAKDADVLIYNSTIEGEIRTMDELIAKCPLLAQFKAVQQGNVWCTGKSFYQATDIVGEMIRDIHHVLTDGDESAMTFLTKVS